MMSATTVARRVPIASSRATSGTTLEEVKAAAAYLREIWGD